jgi:RNA polymerase sporulation-specific sigma factor
MIKDAIKNLSEFERKLINCRIYKDYTQSETAKILGVSQVQVSRYESNIYSRIRKRMEVS